MPANHDCFASSAMTASRERLVEVLLIWIEAVDQSELSRSAAALDLLFSRDRFVHALVRFVLDEALAGVSLGESFDGALPMFERAARQICGHASVERPVTLAGHDVNARLFHPCRRESSSA